MKFFSGRPCDAKRIAYFAVTSNLGSSMDRGRVKKSLSRFAQDNHIDLRRPEIGQTLRGIRIGLHWPDACVKAKAVAEPQMGSDFGSVAVTN